MSTSLKRILFFWQVGLVDTFRLIQFCIKSGTPYSAIVAASAAGNFSDIGPKVLFEPIIGLGTSYKFITAAQKVDSLDCYSSSFLIHFWSISCFNRSGDECSRRWCSSIKWSGGSYNIAKSISLNEFAIVVDSVKTPVLDIHPYRREFTYKSKIIIDNMFREHTARRSM